MSMSMNYSVTSTDDESNIINELRERFAFSTGKGIWKLNSVSKYKLYVLRINEVYGVAVQGEDVKEINETFTKVKLSTQDIILQSGESIRCLTLTCPETASEDEGKFILICCDFIKAVVSDYSKMMNDPFEWWASWKKLMGNVDHEREPYSVISEMITLDMMLTEGLGPTWEGPQGGTVDIRSDKYDCEVKSSKSRYNCQVTISSQSQLRKTCRSLHLRYVCLEQSESGVSVDDMEEILISHGMSRNDIETGLSHYGMTKGKHSRSVPYAPIRIWDFVVDKNFPTVRDESFVGGHPPLGVSKVIYTVDLTSLEHETLEYPLGNRKTSNHDRTERKNAAFWENGVDCPICAWILD